MRSILFDSELKKISGSTLPVDFRAPTKQLHIQLLLGAPKIALMPINADTNLQTYFHFLLFGAIWTPKYPDDAFCVLDRIAGMRPAHCQCQPFQGASRQVHCSQQVLQAKRYET